MEHDSVFQMAAYQDGLDLPSIEDRRETPALNVEDAMQRTRDLVVSDRISVTEALEIITGAEAEALLVELRYGQWRWIGKRELQRARDNGDGDSSLHDTMKMWPVTRTYPDLPLDQAMRNLAIYPTLPVTSRVNPSFLLGTLTLADVHRAYGITQQEPKPESSRTAPSA